MTENANHPYGAPNTAIKVFASTCYWTLNPTLRSDWLGPRDVTAASCVYIFKLNEIRRTGSVFESFWNSGLLNKVTISQLVARDTVVTEVVMRG